jgi:hypothetical protein
MTTTDILKPNIGANTHQARENAADRAAEHAEGAIEKTRVATNHAFDALQARVDDLREGVPSTLSRMATQVDEIARRGIDRARETSVTVKDKVAQAGDRSVGYIRDEPVKSVLIAAAAGAALAALIGWASRSGAGRR